MPTKVVTSISDLANVQLTVRVQVGWRARVAMWLIRLAKWVGGCQVKFIGDAHNG
jgi:hypothetical protein